jgi:chloride channel 3/4/5
MILLRILQIVLLVTKAVGDTLGTRGIADEMIRFNGFPFLEKEDHAYGVSGGLVCCYLTPICPDAIPTLAVATVMRRHLHVLEATGMSVSDVEARLEATQCKGFPIVSADSRRSLLGFIDRAEVRWVIGVCLALAAYLGKADSVVFCR